MTRSGLLKLLPVVSVLVFGAALSVAGFQIVRQQEAARIQSDLDQAADLYIKILQDSLYDSERELASVAGFFTASDKVGFEEFRSFVRPILGRNPGTWAIAWIPRVPAAEKEAFERAARAEVMPDFEIKEWNSEGNIVKATARQDYFPILYTEAIKPAENILAWGIDPMTDPVRREAFFKARDTGLMSATSSIKLLNESFDNRLAVAAIQPIYERGQLVDTIEERRAAIKGFVVGIFRINILVDASLQGLRARGLDIYLFDAPTTSQNQLIHFHPSRLRSGKMAPVGEAELRSGLYAARDMKLATRPWQAIFKPAPGYFVGQSSQALMVLAGGLLLTVLLALYLQSIITQNARISYQVARQTKELSSSESKFKTFFETIVASTMVIDSKGIIQIFNPAAEKVFGYLADEAIGRNVSFLMPEPDQGAHDQYLKSYLETGEAKIIGQGREVTGLRKNGEEFPIHLSIGEVRIDDEIFFVGSAADLTKLKAVEEQLRQAQKMEAVGQLTGGIAHDFNNLLAIIEGNLGLLGEDIDQNLNLSQEELRESIEPALEASRRGAELTHRLLAFSRKQALKPVVLDIDEVVRGMEGMLRRTLGEDIDLRWHFECAGWLAEADASELGNALLNLVINARDAMQEGGKLTIETGQVRLGEEYAAAHADLTAGEYVMLAVSDNGMGMDVATLERVFEPFFTTKALGKGTGLGLSMVFGFVKQSDGHVAIYSEPGEGTTVKLYLPRSLEKGKVDAASKVPPKIGGNETILVVEDDNDVRRMTVRILTRQGYKVLEAGDGRAALTILASENQVHLLLTDIVLPGGMSGPEMAKSATDKTPLLKVLFMSGYAENAALHAGRLDEGIKMISKPISFMDLGIEVRKALGAA